MKRLRNDPTEYLEEGGQWRLRDRKVGSGTDPNPRHTSYYRTQIPELADCSAWMRFPMSLCSSLRVIFRLGWMCPCIIKDVLTRKLAAESGMKLHVWQLAVNSRTLFSHASLQGLSCFLRSEVLLGYVIRQELVSMVPAAL